GIQPPSYKAESTTLITPLVSSPTFDLGDSDKLSISSGGAVSFDSYETLAFSRQALETTVDLVEGFKGTANDFKSMASLERLVGSSSSSSPLAVSHTVRSDSAELAAELADVWAE